MKIVLSKHAKEDKFPILAKHNFHVSEEIIIETVNNPDHEDQISDEPNTIASKEFDELHVLRVVYRKDGDIIKVITFYPAEKGRYY